jgi:hypothetical protein
VKRPNGSDTVAWVCAIALIVVGCNQRLSWQLPLGAREAPYLAWADLVVALGFAVWLLVRLLRRDLRGAAMPPAALWAVAAIAGLSVFQALDLMRPVGELLETNKRAVVNAAKETMQIGLYFVAAYMLLANGLREARAAQLALYAFVVVTAVNVLYGLYTYVQPVALSAERIAELQQWLVYGGQPDGIRAAVDPIGVGSLLSNMYVYGGFLAIALPLLFGLALHERRPWAQAGLGIIIAIGVVTCLSGWHLLLLVAGCIVVAARHSRTAFAAAALGAVVVLGLLPLLLPSNAAAIGEDVLVYREAADERDIKQRWIKWSASVDMLADPNNPRFLLGVGAGSYQAHVGGFYGLAPQREDTRPPDTDSRYLVTASSMGFLGLCALVGAMIYFVRCAFRGDGRLSAAIHPGLAAGLCGSLVAIAGANLIGDTFVRGLYVPVFLVFALAAVVACDAHHSTGE